MTDAMQDFWSNYRSVCDSNETTAYRTIHAESHDGVPVVCYEIDWSPEVPSSVRTRVKHEAQYLATLQHDRLMGPIDFDFAHDKTRVVCPRLSLPRLNDRITAGLSIQETLDVATELLQVLQLIHEHGLIVRCIRPRDIYVQETENALRPVFAGCPALMLLQGFHAGPTASEMLTYAAPETLGALEHDVRAPADLYSIGILLFECLTGKPPFTGENARDLIFHHMTTRVPELTGLNPRIPPALSQIVQRLLQKHPRDRYQSACGVLFDLQQVEEAFSKRGDSCPLTTLVLGTRDQRATLIEPSHVGRTDDLKVLESELEVASNGVSHAVLITAPSGMGKSRLLLETSSMAVARGFRLLKAQGQNVVGLSPLSTVKSALRECVGLVREDSNLRSVLYPRMKEYAGELHAVLPELAHELDLTAPDLRNHELSDRRIAVALATFLGTISNTGQPVLLLLDDAQWADDLTLSILECWQLTVPERTLLIIASRPTDRLTDRLRSSLNFSAQINLSPLTRTDSSQLLESMAGSLPSEILDAVWKMAAGNPFVSSAVLRGLVEGQVLISSDSGWQVDQDQLRNVQMSGEAAEVLKQRLFRLTPKSRHLLTVGAVLGKEFSIETAATLAEVSSETALQNLAEPRENYLIWEKTVEGTCQFVHDQIREAILQTSTSDELRKIHLSAAEHALKTTPNRHFEIACHFDAAGCPDLALPSAIKAAASARRRHALEIAEQQYLIALRSCEALGREPAFEVLNGMGQVLMLSGRYLEAQPMLETAIRCSDSPVTEAEIGLKLGELAFKRDDKDVAVELWEAALRKLGVDLPRNCLMPLYAIREICVQAAHSLFPNQLVHSRQLEASARDRVICQLYSRLAYGYWYLKGKLPLLYVHLRGMNLAEGFAPTTELAQAYSEHAPAMSLIPLSARGIAYGRRSLEIRKSLDDVWGQGQSLHFLSIALYAAGRFEECVDVGRRSIRILERAGDFWEKHIAQYQVAASLFRLGRMTEAVQLAREAYDSGLAVGDEQVCGNIIDVWARATHGDLPHEIVQQELDRPRADVQGRAHVWLARGVQLIADERFNDAAEAFEQGIRISRAAGISNCYTSPLYAWKASAIRSFLELESPLTRRSRQKTIVAHRRAAWKAVFIALRFRTELPHALREVAWSFIFQNRVRRGMLLLKWSMKEAARQSAEYELLQSEHVLHCVRVEERYQGAEAQLQDVDERLFAFRNEQLPRRVAASLSLVDRFDSLLETGRQIASAMDPELILDSMMAASRRLLRSDYCRIVSVDSHGKPSQIPDSLLPHVLHSLEIGEAAVADTPTVEFRSLITCPIFMRGSAVACLVVGNTEVRDLFGANELRIASYLTTISGAALENAEGFRNLQKLNASLEDRVTERTAAVEARSSELQKTADHLRKTQSALASARDAAEVANQAKTDFLAHMSHEIRTPIGAVLGFTELLLHGQQPLQAEQRQHLERVHSNGTHLLRLLNDLLDLSRIEAGELTIEKLSCRPFDLLSDILASLQSRAMDKGLKLLLKVNGRIPETITTDPTRLRQIITNLVGNAIKFTSHGSVEVVIDSLVSEELLAIHVCDTGVGIDPTAQAGVFEPFRQADESVNRRFGGTGLGLSISRDLARALGGDISLASEVGLGSTFTASIATGPLNDVRLLSVEEARAAVPAVSSRANDIDLSGAHILIADDVDANREFISHTLQTAGATCETVDDGQAAIDAWQNGSFDLILMDMRMPVLDGYSAVRMIRDRGAELPIMALTANGMAEDEQRCRDAGCSGYLTKPVSMSALLQGTAQLLGRTPASQNSMTDRTTNSSPQVPVAVLPADNDDCEDQIPTDPFLRDLATRLLPRLERAVPECTGALELEDLVVLSDHGHWMKGTGGNVGLPGISGIGESLEDAVNAGDLSAAATVIEELQRAVNSLKQQLSQPVGQ